MLEANGITVRFGGVIALNDVSVDVSPGDITALLGPNGSGKSTFFNCISGLVTPTSGEISLNGRRLDSMAPSRRAHLGLARTFQTPRFDPDETALSAVMCGLYPRRRSRLGAALVRSPGVRREEARFVDTASAVMDDLGLAGLRGRRLRELSMAQVRMLDVARAIVTTPEYLLLDEPAAGLSHGEQDALSDEVRRVAERGVGVLLVEHNFGLVRNLATTAVVLDRGTRILAAHPDELAADERFLTLYLGGGSKG